MDLVQTKHLNHVMDIVQTNKLHKHSHIHQLLHLRVIAKYNCKNIVRNLKISKLISNNKNNNFNKASNFSIIN